MNEMPLSESWGEKLLEFSPEAIVQFRQELIDRAEFDKAFQRYILEICQQDIVFFVAAFVWQFNPNLIIWEGTKRRRGSMVGPFIPWDFQVEAFHRILDCIEHPSDLAIVKSREMGASWICIIVIAYLFLFMPMSQTLLISKNIEAVDDPSPDSLLWKFDFIMKKLPGWMHPGIRRTLMYRENEKTHAVVTGEPSTGRSGVGGRAVLIFIDEFTLIREDREVYSHTSNTASSRIFNFTHRGTSKFAVDLCRKTDTPQLLMHWSQHPEKNKGLYEYDVTKKRVEVHDKSFVFPPDYKFVMNGTPTGGPFPGLRSPWYDYEVTRKASPQEVAMDLDINPFGSMEQFFDPILLRQLIAESCRPASWRGHILYDEDNAHPIKLEHDPRSTLQIWCALDADGRPPKAKYFIGADASAGTGATPTCISIFDGTRGEKVGQYTNAFVEPSVAGKVLCALGWWFVDEDGKPARLIWEMQGPGIKVGDMIQQLRYPSFYTRVDEGRLSKKISDKPGWVPTPPEKRRVLEDYLEALRCRDFVNPCEESMRECEQFRFKSGQIVHDLEDSATDSGARDSHGDHVIADGLAWKLCKMQLGTKARRKQKLPTFTPILSRKWREEYHERLKRQEEEEILWR